MLLNDYVSIKWNSFTLLIQLIFSALFSVTIYFNLNIIFHHRYLLVSLIVIISLIFALNLGYLMINEYFNNMKGVIKFDTGIHHQINETIIKGIIIFLTLNSSVSILGYIVHISGKPLLMSLIVLSFFVFFLSDITYNEFIRGRNKYIHDTHEDHGHKIYIRPCKLIVNETKDKMPRNPHVIMLYSDIFIKIINMYSYTDKLIKLCKLSSSYKDIEKYSNSIMSLLEVLIRNEKKPKHYNINYDVLDLKIRWFHLRNKLNRMNTDDLSTMKLNSINYYKTKISDVLKDVK